MLQLQEKIEERQQRDARMRGMIEANEQKKVKEKELEGNLNVKDPNSTLGDDG